MILDRMTFDEVFQQLKLDILNYDRHFEFHRNYLAKKIRKFHNKTRIWHNPREFTIKNGFHFVTLFFSGPVGDPPSNRLCYIKYCWFVIKKNIYFFHFSGRNNFSFDSVKLYTSHFVDRYNERHLKNYKLSKLEVFKTFVQNNLSSSLRFIPTEEHQAGYVEIVNDGLIFGDLSYSKTLNCYIYINRTYVSWDMIGQDQRQLAIEGKLVLSAIGIDITVPEDDFLPMFGNPKNAKFIETDIVKHSIEAIKQAGEDKSLTDVNFNDCPLLVLKVNNI